MATVFGYREDGDVSGDRATFYRGGLTMGKIEAIVGVPRHETIHVARAVSAGQRVYILHSRECIERITDRGSDLRLCPFSVALDEGIDLDLWGEWQDRPVEVRIDEEFDDLVPERTHRPEGRES